ncbi:AAA-domain-containing protein [Xylona heveae TC161]|uniref:AAA-domain-containing protein n=1 Tax=Xylona heveae (strain CBS 132557 / TC161) TaxID=1328760 RepID=A0A165IML4_XYLHT|nr:AAA-domain-containing protein [Xylona heveae TC161]KZF25113.1 AAA-domain-containing protein [Xylona heveae TC161]
MPNRSKRNLDDFDPNKSDSDDLNYDEAEARPARKRPKKSQSKKSSKKRRHAGYGGGSSDDITDDDDMSEGSFEDFDDEEEEPERDPITGRPRRQATKQRPKYEESDDEAEEDFIESSEEEKHPSKTPSKSKSKSKGSSLLVKLALPKGGATPYRNTRARSGSRGLGRGATPDFQATPGTRRSSRIAHDDSETFVALSTSGHHADIIRPGSQSLSPEGPSKRPVRGGKGLKGPVPSVIQEEEDEGSFPNEHRSSQFDQAVQDSSDVEMQAKDEAEAASTYEGQDIENKDDLNVDLDENRANEEASGATAHDENDDDDDDEDDDEPIFSRSRASRAGRDTVPELQQAQPDANASDGDESPLKSRRATRSSQNQRKPAVEESSDFEPNPEEEEGDEDVSGSEGSSRRKGRQRNEEEDDRSAGRRSHRLKDKSRSSTRNRRGSDSEANSDGVDAAEEAEELAEELEELRSGRKRPARTEIIYEKPTRRARKTVDYRIMRPDLAFPTEETEPAAESTPTRRGRGGGGGGWQRSLFSTYGPFGGAGGPPPLFGGPHNSTATGGVDSDSSDDEGMQRPRGAGASVGGAGMLPSMFGDAAQGLSGTPVNLGKVKDKQTLADADPLGVDQNVNFGSVGGLDEHINQLKEMVSLPLLYPEIFTRFHVTPPRGVLFHGPPGTGKTLLARALASSVSSQGRKVTFYMRKGADALSKWVGEAERQLRLLFEEARRTQPSIIFFDEIDGLAPVRSSKQEQIHASIVSTLLALMDGMDGRGQVIVIGATNRPDSIDPALRRPGRFDREFYFPLPGTEGRRKIIDIHTKGWNPPLESSFKDQLAEVTKGYGGADLRALCTEAALNAVQRRYPQIYSSNEKLVIDPASINVTARDFMISVKKIVPSSERSTSSGASPLPKIIEPLLRQPLAEIKAILADILPPKKRLTALEEAHYEDAQDDGGFFREKMLQEFERSRVFRPRLLLRGQPGMGQQYLAAALLNHFEGLHVQSFDLSVLLSDSTRSPEAAVVQLFAEVRRHKPSVIYIPNVNTWYQTLTGSTISTFLGMLRSLSPSEPVLVLGVLENDGDEPADSAIVRDLFGFSRKGRYELGRPQHPWRHEFFSNLINYIQMAPKDFPDPVNRKKRKLETLPIAPPPPPIKPQISKEELKAQRRKDRQTLNLLKLRIQPVMDQIRLKYKRFRTGIVDDSQIKYLFEDENPEIITSDLPQEQRQQHLLFRPYEKGQDENGVPGLLEVASNKFFYNLEIVTIEKRLSNGFYKRPRDFLADIKRLAKDARNSGDQDRTLKANEMLANVEVDIGLIETSDPAFVAECEQVYAREKEREKQKAEKAQKAAAAEENPFFPRKRLDEQGSSSEQQSSGPVVLGEPIPGTSNLNPTTPSRPPFKTTSTSLSNGYLEGDSSHDSTTRYGQSNGSSGATHGDGDTHMTDSEEGQRTGPHTQQTDSNRSTQYSQPSYSGHDQQAQAHSSQKPAIPNWLQPSGQSTQNTPRSQKSALTMMPPGSQIDDFVNDASTTPSEKKTSDHSNRSSGPFFNTQSSNGLYVHVQRGDGPDFTALPDRTSGDSQLPDTQEMAFSQTSIPSSQQSQPRSQQGSQPPVPPFNAPHRHAASGSISSILNQSDQRGQLILDDEYIRELHDQLTERTSGCSVEQLEQINTALMDCIWRERGEWNRTKVGREVSQVFEEVMRDILEMQEVLPESLPLE